MSAESITRRARLAALAIMVDACTISRQTDTITNPDTGRVVRVTTVIYTGACRAQRRTFFDRPHDVGQALEWMLAVELQIPWTVDGVSVDDFATLTASRDTDLIGRVFHVRGLSHKTHSSSRRLACVEINS